MTILAVVILLCDIKNRTIPNKLVVVLLFSTLYFNGVSYNFVWAGKVIVIVVFLVFLYAKSIWGGGDAKVAIAFLPAISEQYLSGYIAAIGLFGGILALFYLLLSYLKNNENKRKIALPFCVPICASGVLFSIASF